MSTATLTSSWDRAVKYIPNGCQTLSKCPNRYVNGIYPKMLASGHGCEVVDEEGKSYTDYISSLGAILLGYNNPAVDDAVKESINSGEVILSLPHPKEGEFAEKLSNQICHEKIKFFKTGSEATSAAVRVARAYTKRDVILTCGYNGWHDWAAITYDRPAGIPTGLSGYTGKFKYNDLESLEFCFRAMRPVAAVILEPMVFEEPKDGFLEKLIKLAHQHGALVIFDEIVTGFRMGPIGLAGLFNLAPDLMCLGKAMGNGYPIAALAGSTEIMNVFEHDDFIASGTFSGDLIGISAAMATLEQYRMSKIYEPSSLLKAGFNGIAEELDIPVSCLGYSPRTMFQFPTPEHRALFWQECLKRGVLFGYANFVTQSHGMNIINNTLNVCQEALGIVKAAWDNPLAKLEGDLPVAVLR